MWDLEINVLIPFFDTRREKSFYRIEDIDLIANGVAFQRIAAVLNKNVLTQVEALMNYGEEISSDYQRWTIAHAILETAERFSPHEQEPAPQEFALVVGGMRALAENRYDPSLILDAFLLRSLSIGGYAPSLSQCSRCEKPGPHRYFSLVGGGSVCNDCRPSASATPAPETLQLMDALLNSDWQTASASEGKNRREASGLIAAYLQWHLERGLRSLPMVERA